MNDINVVKQKCEQILNKKLFIKQSNIITDENNSFEIMCNEEFINLNNIYFNNYTDFIAEFSKLNSKDQDEKYKAYVNYLGYDKRLNGDYLEKIKLIEEGKYLDLLINDQDYFVRRAIASCDYGLDILINDKSYYVRYEVAKRGYGLDILINDENYLVRAAVAGRKYGLNKLIKDKNCNVLKVVAEQGYGLDILIKSTGDGSTDIKNACKNWLKAHNMTIKDYEKKLKENKNYDWINI